MARRPALQILHLLLTGLLAACCRADAQVQPIRPKGVTRALVVGISEYQDPRVGHLRYAHRDAALFVRMLEAGALGQVAPENIQLLTNGDATEARFRTMLDWLRQQSRAGDQVILYFSGHGDVGKTVSRPEYLLLHDATDQSYSLGGAIKLRDLQEEITTLSSEIGARVIVILDACRAGKLGDARIDDEGALGREGLQRQATNEIKLLSCKPDQFSQEGPQWNGGQGVFTHYLIKGLTGMADHNQDDVVTASELRRYLHDAINEDLAPLRQHPVITAKEEDQAIAFIDPSSPFLAGTIEKPPVHLLLSTHAKSRKEEALIARVDSSHLDNYRLFFKALRDKAFSEPANDCADHYFRLLLEESALADIHPFLRREYAIALQEDAQQMMRQLILVEGEELNKLAVERIREYALYIPRLDKAMEVLGARHAMTRELETRKLLFRGILAYLESRGQKGPEYYGAIAPILQEVLAHDPENRLALFYLMEAACSRTKPVMVDTARYYFQTVIRLYPDWVMPYTFFGECLSKEADHRKEAWQVLDAGHQCDSSNAFHAKAIANYHYRIRDFHAAIKGYQNALRLDPDDHILLSNMGYAWLALQQPEEAEKALRQSLAMEDRQVPAHLGLCKLYVESGRLTEGETHCRKVMDIHPRRPEPYRILIAHHLDNGHWAKAQPLVDLMEKQVSPDGYWLAYYRFYMAALQEKWETALEHLQSTLSAGLSDRQLLEEKTNLARCLSRPEFRQLLDAHFQPEK